MGKILVTGSLHYDIVIHAHHRPEKGETVMGSGCSYKFGGKGGNQAVSAAKAGAQVSFAGAVGADTQGDFLRSVLEENGVNTDFVAVSADVPSGMSVALMDAEGDYGAVVVSNANNRVDATQFGHDAVWQQVEMLLLQNEVPEAVNLAAAEAAKQRGIRVCLNAAPARAMCSAMQSAVGLLVVNGVEARDLSGIAVNTLSDARAAAEWLGGHYPAVVVTAGEHGVAWCETGERSQSMPAEKVELISTHGAGDCFMGMLCTSLLQGKTLADSVAKANRAAAEHVSRKE
ncbi:MULTISPECIES: ribokinase [Rahnella]|jgi:ribokinase|uniref:ribokinase n=1 Tax=Rahnella TaxID=34037 RepID=UPI001C273142|nr:MULTISPECIES: ribokinase [unclassified Rahnella]MBU9819137.1 ribokinase [Rahnella sp. BCC 1045]MCS3423178.1 ribokinase [Rahnella sp. BIGb0603]